ncbi:MAG: ferritin family protein [Sedimentisphaerales bacterium]|nr:ferritin family protein [Sedimentisphaerales bacterium]
MTRDFNAIEVFEIAEQIERNGATFYRRAAELFETGAVSKVFANLAAWEVKHEEILSGMRRDLGEEGAELATFDPEKSPLDAKAMAGLAAFGVNRDPAAELRGSESRAEVLKMALQKEKDTVVFYTGLKGFVCSGAVEEKIDDIIKEELRHIRIISEAIEQGG